MTPFPPSPNTAVPLAKVVPDYLSLEDLEAIAFEFSHLGVSIVAAAPDEWHLTVPLKGVQTTFKAHRPAGGVA